MVRGGDAIGDRWLLRLAASDEELRLLRSIGDQLRRAHGVEHRERHELEQRIGRTAQERHEASRSCVVEHAGGMKLGDARRGEPGRDAIAERTQLGRCDVELGCDHHRDPGLRRREQGLRRADPRVVGRRPPHDLDRELAADPRRPRPRAQLVALDDLDEVALEDAQDFAAPGIHATILRAPCHLEQVQLVALTAIAIAGSARIATASCDGAVRAAGAHELTRASVELTSCDDSKVTSKIEEALRASELSELSIVSPTADATIEIEELPGVTLPASATVWLRAGTYHLRSGDVRIIVTTRARARSVQIMPGPPKPPAPPQAGHQDFTEDNAGDTNSGPPPDIKHPSLLPNKYLGIPDAPSGEELADPMAVAVRPRGSHPPWQLSAGLRVAGGMFQQTGADARAGVEIGVVVRDRLDPKVLASNLLLELRGDWSQRGGTTAQADALGLTFGPAVTLGTAGSIDFRVGLGARGDIRLEDSIAGMAVNRFGLDGVAWLDIEPENSPLIFGLRFEQGITTLTGNDRDRAVLAQVGVNTH